MAAAINKNQRNKLIAGVVLLLIAAVMLYRAFTPSAPSAPVAATSPGQAGKSSALSQFQNPSLSAAQRQRSAAGRRAAIANAGNINDPKLRLDLFQKVANVKYDPGGRNLFAFYTPPPPPLPKPKQPGIVDKGGPAGPAAAVTPPAPPPPPPIPLKFYGYAHKPGDTRKKVFLIEDNEIYIASEGDLVKKRYRINKIGVNTVEVEDTVNKNKQSLPLQENP